MRAPSDQAAAALAYARRGWAVLPCHHPSPGGCSCANADCASPAKHPRTRRGLHDATTELRTVKRWWRRWPTANVGLRTGAASGLVVLDVDPGHGGEASLAQLVDAHEALPATLEVRTGGGGRHLYFAHPGGRVANSAGGLGRGLDVRGDGGYILAPPSRHATGGTYRRLTHAPPAALPGWLQALLTSRRHEATSAVTVAAVDVDRSRASAWARAALVAEATRVRQAAVGTRNHTLNRAAFALGQIVAGGHLDAADAAGLLHDAALAAGLEEAEIRSTIASGLSAGGICPRHPGQRPPGAS
jgi:hypothetical protein